MATPDWDNLDEFIDPDDFGQKVIFITQGGIQVPVVGIFDESYLSADLGEYEADSSSPRFTAKTSTVLGIARGDTVTIDGDVYDVMGYAQMDGNGFSVIPLSRVNA